MAHFPKNAARNLVKQRLKRSGVESGPHKVPNEASKIMESGCPTTKKCTKIPAFFRVPS